tara:strand:+ start:75 stop:659 length:585 start_codon:yes stop_codon:yes gene_type:complete
MSNSFDKAWKVAKEDDDAPQKDDRLQGLRTGLMLGAEESVPFTSDRFEFLDHQPTMINPTSPYNNPAFRAILDKYDEMGLSQTDIESPQFDAMVDAKDMDLAELGYMPIKFEGERIIDPNDEWKMKPWIHPDGHEVIPLTDSEAERRGLMIPHSEEIYPGTTLYDNKRNRYLNIPPYAYREIRRLMDWLYGGDN